MVREWNTVIDLSLLKADVRHEVVELPNNPGSKEIASSQQISLSRRYGTDIMVLRVDW